MSNRLLPLTYARSGEVYARCPASTCDLTAAYIELNDTSNFRFSLLQLRLDRRQAQYEKPMGKPYQLKHNFAELIFTAAAVVYGWEMQVTAHGAAKTTVSLGRQVHQWKY